jgi:hypothetical protein
MSNTASATGNSTPQANKKNRLVPPEQRFWKRYSPHHEFPLSAVSSLMLHVLGFFLIALVIGGFLFSIRPDDRPPEVEAIVIAGGGGRLDGADAGKAGGTVPQEAVVQQPDPLKTPVVSPAEELKNLSAEPRKLDLVKESDSDRTIDTDAAAVASALANVQERARQQIAGLLAPKGRGGSGEGGGLGEGSGPGEGNLSGPGKARMSQREKRQLRWTMMFNTRDGNDYLRQLQALGAILAIPQEGGQFLVLKDLSRRPAVGEIEDITKINRIYWIDDKQQSVTSLSNALGLVPPPRLIAAFFPESLEKELLDKERRWFKGSEDDILETKFQVSHRGGTYEAVVVGVTGKSPRSRR